MATVTSPFKSFATHAQHLHGVRPEIIGEAPALQDLLRMIERLADSDIPVLIKGESGTGKSLAARALHDGSRRAAQSFVTVNLGAIPPGLMETEIFGRKADGIEPSRPGGIHRAAGGTLFLQEITELPRPLQRRLLGLLADCDALASDAQPRISPDVRIIASGPADLPQRAAAGDFCPELFHRLCGVRIRLPALRERREDIPRLLRHFLNRSAWELHVEPRVLDAECEAYLSRLPWSGNVRELENACRWITAVSARRSVGMAELLRELPPPADQPEAADESWEERFKAWVGERLRKGESRLARDAIRAAEAILVSTALEMARGRKQDAARLLGYGRNTLSRKLAELGQTSASDKAAANEGSSGSGPDEYENTA